MIRVTQKSRVYIFAPAGISTGGPECLHQLGRDLKNLGLNVFMYYVPTNNPAPIHPAYEHYAIPFINKIEDTEDNIIITPELYSYIMLLKDFKNTQKIIWWLSVDNFYASYYYSKRKVRGKIIWVINELSKMVFKKPVIDFPKVALNVKIDFSFLKDLKIGLHFAQSDYAKHLLESKGIDTVEYLFDYIEGGESLQYDNINKKDIVLFNPAKGVGFTKKVIARSPQITFIPIQKLNRAGVIDLMKKAKVYIDFGNHPGRDKMPREAALCGCIIITGKRGSAFFKKDIDIPDTYKFEDTASSIPQIIKTIEESFENFDSESKKFASYREIVKNDRPEFITKLKSIFQIK